MDKLPFAIDSGPIQQNFDQLRTDRDALSAADTALDARLDALEALGLTKRTRGVATVTTSAAVSGTAVVTHALGTTPNNVQVTSQNSSGAGAAIVGVTGVGATQFTIQMRYKDEVARSASVDVGWEAIA